MDGAIFIVGNVRRSSTLGIHPSMLEGTMRLFRFLVAFVNFFSVVRDDGGTSFRVDVMDGASGGGACFSGRARIDCS